LKKARVEDHRYGTGKYIQGTWENIVIGLSGSGKKLGRINWKFSIWREELIN
jgi:hypothetical protein